VEGETRWTRDCVSALSVLSLFAGAAAGALGIAAALLIGPLLLQVCGIRLFWDQKSPTLGAFELERDLHPLRIGPLLLQVCGTRLFWDQKM